VPRAEPRARFTMLFEDVAIALLQGMTTAAVARRLGIGRDEADGIRRRAVRRGWRRRTARVMKHPRVDGKHAGHGLRPMIVSRVDDGKARVVHVAQGKDQAALDAFRRGLTDERSGGTGPVAMDMSEAYTDPVPRHVPGGRRPGRPDHPPRKARSRFRRLQGIARRTAKAWEFKELPRKFRECPDRETGRRHLREWLRCALRSTLAPVRRVARMCGRHPGNLPAFFARRGTNASAEAVDSRIRSLINQACGYRNPRRLVTEIFFHYGDLDLAPRFPC
jgi:transposase